VGDGTARIAWKRRGNLPEREDESRKPSEKSTTTVGRRTKTQGGALGYRDTEKWKSR